MHGVRAGSYQERFRWVSSYSDPDNDLLTMLDQRMRDFYGRIALDVGYFEKAEAGNKDWLDGNYPLHEAMLGFLRPGQVVVEFSCGNGHARKVFVERGCRYVGFDLNHKALRKTAIRFGATPFAVSDGYKAAIRSGSADFVLSLYAIEHIIWPARYLDEMLRVTKPGGYIVLAFPDYLVNTRRTCQSMRFGKGPGGAREKLSRGRFFDAARTFFEARFSYPARLRSAREDVFRRGQFRFLINTSPACLAGPFYSDADAVHFACEEEIASYLEQHGCVIELRSGSIKRRDGSATEGFVVARRSAA